MFLFFIYSVTEYPLPLMQHLRVQPDTAFPPVQFTFPVEDARATVILNIVQQFGGDRDTRLLPYSRYKQTSRVGANGDRLTTPAMLHFRMPSVFCVEERASDASYHAA